MPSQELFHTKKQKESLDALLHIRDVETETIFGIIGRMESALSVLGATRDLKGLIPFLYTYQRITKAVALERTLNPQHIKNAAALEALDVRFASLYFCPLYTFLTEGTAQTPWRTCFEYSRLNQRTAFLQVILGINAHINSDLACIVAKLPYEERKDYLLINAILEREIPPLMSFLAFDKYDHLGLGGFVFRRLTVQKFQSVIVKWRLLAWENAKKLRKNPKLLPEMHRQTEEIAANLILVFDKLYTFKNIRENLNLLDTLEVRI